MLFKISASAGSGKTYTLTNEFISHLRGASLDAPLMGCSLQSCGSVYALSEIIAATFTNKAAAEMKGRILNKLKEQALAQLLEEKLSHTKHAHHAQDTRAKQEYPLIQHHSSHSSKQYHPAQWVDYILKNYSSLQIRTIDSLLTTLVRLSVLELGLAPDFTPSFSPAEYFTPVYEELIEDLQHQQNSTAFFTATQPELMTALEDACKEAILTSEKKGFTVGESLSSMLLALVNMLLQDKAVPPANSAVIRQSIQNKQATLQKLALQLLQALTTEKLKVRQDFIKHLTNASTHTHLFSFPSSAYATKADLNECLNAASKGTASAASYALYRQYAEAQSDWQATLPLLKSALRFAPLTLLANEIYARVLHKRVQHALVPALSLPLLAKKVLQAEHGISSALCRLGTRLRHILLDEFQDTSVEQWASMLPLVEECLSNGGSLTYVGDVKQAIYSWRGGQASLFNNVQHEPSLRAIVHQPQSLNLPHNWRSSPNIIRHNNLFFSLIAQPHIAHSLLAAMLPKSTPNPYIEQAAAQAVETFSSVHQDLPATLRTTRNHDGSVHLYEAEAPTVPLVQNLVRMRLTQLFTQELFPQWQYSDVAVLVHKGDQAKFVAQVLQDCHIPVITENSFLLADQPVIRRLTALLTFLDYPLDNASFWEFITGAECLGVATCNDPIISSAALHQWIASIPAKGRPPLYTLFKDAFPQIWDAWIAPFFNQAGLMSAYDMIAEIISHYALMEQRPAYAPLLRRFLELAYKAESQGLSSLASFLSFWNKQQELEKVPLPESMNAVQILTMHKAKGLEFPVVIIPFLHNDNAYKPILDTFTYEGKELLAQAGKEHSQKFHNQAITEALECLHLLYVAWTRPIYELHAFITRPRSRVPHSPLAKGLLVLLDAFKQETTPENYYYEVLALPEEEEKETTAASQEQPFSMPHRTDALDLPNPLGRSATSQAGAALTWATDATPSLEAGATSLPMGTAPSLPAATLSSSSAATSPSVKATPTTVHAIEFSPTESALLLPLAAKETHLPQVQPAAAWRPMAWLPRLKIYRSMLEGIALTPDRRGTLAHLCLEHFTYSYENNVDHSKEKLVAQDLHLAIKHALRLFPLPLNDTEKVEQDMFTCLYWFLLQENTRLWLETGKREQGMLGNEGKVFRVDLLVETEDVLHAIDYKTGAPNIRNVEQMQNYMTLLAQAQDKPVQGTLVYLDEQHFVQVNI